MRRPGATIAWQWLPLLLIPGMVFAAYWAGLGGGFAFDDFPNIVDNTALHVATWDWHAWSAAALSSEAGTLQRPLAMLSFALNHMATGLDPVPMKATNIAIHAVNALLALGLSRKLLQLAHPRESTAPAATFAAAAWALHPLNLMTVLLIVQRMESLSHFFVLAGLWMYLHGRTQQLARQPGWGWILGGLAGGTVLGTLAKESAALLPLYALLAEVCLLRFERPDGRRDRWLLLLYASGLVPVVAGIAWLLPATAPAYAMRDFSLSERLMTEGRVVMDYLRWSVAPNLRELGLYHDDYPVSRGLLQPVATLAAFAAIAALLLFAAWLRRRRPLAALGILWFFAAQVLTATFLPLELVYEHRNYFATFGLCLAGADLLLVGARLRNARIVVAVVAVAFLSATTALRAREWSDPYRFAQTEAAKHPQSPRATYALGQVLTVMTQYHHDSPLLPRAFDALEQARQVPGSGLLPCSGLLLLAANTGHPLRDECWSEMRARVGSRPPSPQDINAIMALTRCARDDTCRFPRAQMQGLYEAALASRANADLLTAYGDYALNAMGDANLALRLWTRAVAVRPTVAQYRINLIKLLIFLRRDEDAQHQITALRAIGRLGQNEGPAVELEARLARGQVGASPRASQVH